MRKRLHSLRFRVERDAPLRKPSPVYVGLARYNDRPCGFYVRVGSRCIGATYR